MCGIAGAIYRDGHRPDEPLLRAMARTITHRGPDAEGVVSLAGCGLAHRRLSIIDLSDAARQPMSAADGKVWVAFNGEIYNFRELRRSLEQRGHAFHTASDTEVVLAAWLAWGEAAFEKLDGMFAIALWDSRERRLVLARDRTGKKPLYVYEDAGKLVFGSELKAILAHPGVDDRLSPEAVPQFLSHGYVPTPGTFFARIRKVPPSTYEVHDLDRWTSRSVQYWDFPARAERFVESTDDLREAERRVRELFFEAVKKRLVSDVPLGAFLSGGIDSTLVVAAMAALSDTRVKTFSIGFEGYPDWDETRWARQVAERYGTDHTEFHVRPEDFDVVDLLAWHYDEPFGDSSAIPTYLVSKLTRAKVTVALTGDGGDELFAGYPRFIGAMLAERLPRPIRSLARRVVGPLPHGKEHQGTWERARRFAQQASRELPDRLRAWVSIFPTDELLPLLQPDVQRYASPGVLGESYQRAFERAARADTLNQILYANARTYLLDDLNVKMDRASMAVGLETRAPFLDTRLMEYVFSLPGHTKVRGRTTKWILKRAMRDLLPDEIVTRKKMGFGVPLGAWFRGSLADRLDEGLLRRGARLHDFVRPDALAELVRRHRAHERDYGLQFWNLFMLDHFLEHLPAAPAEAAPAAVSGTSRPAARP